MVNVWVLVTEFRMTLNEEVTSHALVSVYDIRPFAEFVEPFSGGLSPKS